MKVIFADAGLQMKGLVKEGFWHIEKVGIYSGQWCLLQIGFDYSRSFANPVELKDVFSEIEVVSESEVLGGSLTKNEL